MPMKIYRRSTDAQGEVYQLIQPGPDCIIEFDNSDATELDVEFRLTDVNQADPAGRFRLRVSGSKFRLEAPTLTRWQDSKVLLECDADGVSKLEFTEEGLDRLIELLLVYVSSGSVVGVKFAQAVQTALMA